MDVNAFPSQGCPWLAISNYIKSLHGAGPGAGGAGEKVSKDDYPFGKRSVMMALLEGRPREPRAHWLNGLLVELCNSEMIAMGA